jgi:hypothetical protein
MREVMLPAALGALVACLVAALLYLNLDSGLVRPVPAERLVSVPLLGLGLIFGVGAWTASYTGNRLRGRLLAGLAIGVGGYALLRLVVT